MHFYCCLMDALNHVEETVSTQFCNFFTARRNAHIASAVQAIAIPSVCLSVRHTPVLCQNDGM